MSLRKKYVEVESITDVAGNEKPLVIHWQSGEKYRVTDVLKTVNRQHAKVGGTGTCYVCQFENGHISNVFREALEDDASSVIGARWFVEEKIAAPPAGPVGGAAR